MTKTNYNKRLDELQLILIRLLADVDDRMEFAGTIFKSKDSAAQDVTEALERAKSALTQLFKDLVAEANPLNPKGNANAVWAQKPYADGVKSFEQNLLKLLEER